MPIFCIKTRFDNRPKYSNNPNVDVYFTLLFINNGFIKVPSDDAVFICSGNSLGRHTQPERMKSFNFNKIASSGHKVKSKWLFIGFDSNHTNELPNKPPKCNTTPKHSFYTVLVLWNWLTKDCRQSSLNWIASMTRLNF